MQGFINDGLRVLLLIVAGVLLVGMVSCGGGGGAIRESEGVSRGKKNPVAPNVDVVYNNGYLISVDGKDMQSVELTFSSGLHEVYMLSKKGTCFSPSRDGIAEIKVMNKGGDYWYFDNAGDPVTDDERQASGLLGTTLGLVTKVVKPVPNIRVSCTGGPYDKNASGANGNGKGNGKRMSGLGDVVVNVTSNVTYTEVKVATSTDAVLTYDTGGTTSGSYDTQDTVTVEAVLVTTTDGAKWYFDAAGNVLPLDSKWYQDLD
jgi:hypothetical protein